MLSSCGQDSALVTFPIAPVTEVSALVAISGFACAANWYARQAKLLFLVRVPALKTPPVRSVTLTPVKELVVPVLLLSAVCQCVDGSMRSCTRLPSDAEELRVDESGIESISQEVSILVRVGDSALVLSWSQRRPHERRHTRLTQL
jgi:hypothetical protein